MAFVKKNLVLALILLVMAAESGFLVASWTIRDGKEAAAADAAKKEAEAANARADGKPIPSSQPGDHKTAEVPLCGPIRVKNSKFPTVEVTIETRVFAQVPADKQKDFERFVSKRENQFQSVISTAFREAKHTELQEPGLRTFKHRLRSVVRRVVTSEFDYIEALIIPELHVN